MLEVEYKLSLHKGEHDGRWNINKDKGTITFNLPLLYSHSKKIIARHRGYECPDGNSCESLVIEHFIESLIETELIERICIERGYQKIKIKGGRCKPFCHVEKIALLMAYPDEWNGHKGVKAWINDQRRKSGIEVNGVGVT